MMKMLIAAAMAVSLIGCTSQAQRNTMDDQQCRSYGAKPGSDTYVQCRLVQQARDDERRRAIGNALRDAGDSMEENARRMRSERPVTCTRGGFGGNTVTCY